MIIKNSITIDAPIEKVWDALINPTFTTQYMYGCVPLTDWKIGSPLLWQGQYEGQDMVFVKGSIVAFEPYNALIYTVIDPLNPNIPDIPENYLTVTYTLKQQKGKTDLKLASLRRDKALVGEARQVAIEIVNADPTLAEHSDLAEEMRLFVDPEEAKFLFKS